MKKYLIVLLSPFLLFACDGGSSGGGDVGVGDGTAPVINRIELMVETGSTYKATKQFSPGNKANSRVYATDPDLDMVKIEYTFYYPDDHTIYLGPIIENLGSQPNAEMGYSGLDGMTVPNISGQVRYEYKITDSKGHTSNVFVGYFIIQ